MSLQLAQLGRAELSLLHLPPCCGSPICYISFNPSFFSKQEYKVLRTKKRDPRICIIFVDMFISDKWLGGL